MSNARFVNKGLLKSDLATLNALINYFEKGGTIKVAKPAKRPKSGITRGKSINVKG
jgi:hypothetical protein